MVYEIAVEVIYKEQFCGLEQWLGLVGHNPKMGRRSVLREQQKKKKNA